MKGDKKINIFLFYHIIEIKLKENLMSKNVIKIRTFKTIFKFKHYSVGEILFL